MGWEEIGRAAGPDGEELVLYRSGHDFALRVDGWELMSSRAHGSEESLARLACDEIRGSPGPRILVGGLGLGYTLRAALDALPSEASVTVAEVVPAVVAWNRADVGAVTGWPLRDPRVEVVVEDVGEVLRDCRNRFDAVLLDVDNGPQCLSRERNRSLYGADGLRAARRALRRGGVLAVWTPSPEEGLAARLEGAGFSVRCQPCPPRPGVERVEHAVYVARIAEAGDGPGADLAP